jgi:hypothetical protein
MANKYMVDLGMHPLHVHAQAQHLPHGHTNFDDDGSISHQKRARTYSRRPGFTGRDAHTLIVLAHDRQADRGSEQNAIGRTRTVTDSDTPTHWPLPLYTIRLGTLSEPIRPARRIPRLS